MNKAQSMLIGQASSGSLTKAMSPRICAAVALLVMLMVAVSTTMAATRITLMQMGDVHGHLQPLPNLRSDGIGLEEGGLARLYSRIIAIRASSANHLLFNTGDTIQGSAEALYTSGQALVDVLDRFGIDGYVPGNWDYLYGRSRFIQLFGFGRWGGVASNVYNDGGPWDGKRVLPPYRIKQVAGIKFGVLGLSTDRALNALGEFATEGLRFNGDASEVPIFVDRLKNIEKVDVIILLSEFGLAKNVGIAENNPDIDIILSSDMHEETPQPVTAASGALISEVGHGGAHLAQIDLFFEGKTLVDTRYKLHTITTAIKAHPTIQKAIYVARLPFEAGPYFRGHINPINGTVLTTPLSTTLGFTSTDLYRGNFSHEALPGVIEGTSSNLIADALRDEAGTDIGHARGNRFGTHVPLGAITLTDLNHYLAIGALIAKTTIKGQQLKENIENSLEGSLSPDLSQWTGGWVHAYGGVRFDLDPYKPKGSRASNISIKRAASGLWEPLNTEADYSFAGYWYEKAPEVVGGITTETEVTALTGIDGSHLDVTRVLANYLATEVANPEINRIRLLFALPPPAYGNPEIQPLRGVPTLH